MPPLVFGNVEQALDPHHGIAFEPFGDQLIDALFVLDQPEQDAVKHRIGRQRILVLLIGAQFGRWGAGDDPFGHHRAIGAEADLRFVAVAPFADRKNGHLVGVFQRVIAAGHIAIDRGIADAHLALVASGQQHRAKFVAERHQGHAADPRLHVLFGDVVFGIGKAARQHLVKGHYRRIDRNGVITAADHRCTLGRKVEA